MDARAWNGPGDRTSGERPCSLSPGRHDDLLAVRNGCSEIDGFEGGSGLRPPSPRDRVVYPAPVREAVEARLEDLADDMHDELARRCRLRPKVERQSR
jgi:hypothetical protein